MANDNWFVIVNPASNSGRGQKYWDKNIAQKLVLSGLQFETVFTEHEGHGIELTTQAIAKGYRNIIAVGGDGTYNEVVNGILNQKEVLPTNITLSMIALGTGNDWVKTMHIPTNIDDAINVIKNGKTYIQDIGLATYYQGTQKKQRYFLNVAGTGFDAYVAQRLEGGKRFGKLTYFIELFLGLINFKTIPIRVKTKAKEAKAKVFTVAVGICQYFGSGMKIAPNAVPNDGLFDITLIKDISKVGVIKQLKNLYDGSFVKHPQVETFRTTNISIQSSQDIYLQLDGELLGHGPIEFEIVPQSLKVLVNAQEMPG